MITGNGPFTTGEIATAAGVPHWRIVNILKSRPLEPVQRVGAFKLYSKSDAEFLISVSNRIDRERGIVRRQSAHA